MKTYVANHTKEALSEHVLEKISCSHHRIHKPGTGIFSMGIAQVGNKLCLAGDIMLGNNHYGIVSAPGYGLGWFSSHLSESYLCEKFLPQEWQWEVAVEHINEMIGYDEEGWWKERADKLKAFIADPCWAYDVPMLSEFYEFMTSIGGDGCELPGYDYPHVQAGLLCAIQQRYRCLSQGINS